MTNYGITHMGTPIYFRYHRASFDWMSIGARIRTMRKTAGLRQAELAKLACIDQSTLSDIENGAGFGADTLVLLADALGTTAEQIMRGGDVRPGPFSAGVMAAVGALDEQALMRVENVVRALLGLPGLSAALQENDQKKKPSDYPDPSPNEVARALEYAQRGKTALGGANGGSSKNGRVPVKRTSRRP